MSVFYWTEQKVGRLFYYAQQFSYDWGKVHNLFPRYTTKQLQNKYYYEKKKLLEAKQSANSALELSSEPLSHKLIVFYDQRFINYE